MSDRLMKDARAALKCITRLFGKEGENWTQGGNYAYDDQGLGVTPFSDVACKWCLTGAVYRAFRHDEDLFWENTLGVSNGDDRHLQDEGRAFPGNQLLASSFADAMQEMDERGRIPRDAREQIQQACDTFEEQLQVFNDAVTWETMAQFLHYAGLCLELKIDHINHWSKA